MQILSHDIAEQETLFNKMMRLSNGERASTIKGATINLLVQVILVTSSNPEEAILQWNELSIIAESFFRDRWKSPLPSEFNPAEIKFNGG